MGRTGLLEWWAHFPSPAFSHLDSVVPKWLSQPVKLFCLNVRLPQSCSALYPLFLANTANGTGKSQWIHFHLLQVEVICLMNLADGWMVASPLCLLSFLCYGLNHDWTGAFDCSEWWINARLKQGVCLALLFSSQLPELDSGRDGKVEFDVSILQSAKCWNVTQDKQEELIYLLLLWH